MTTTSYRTIPSSTYAGVGSQTKHGEMNFQLNLTHRISVGPYNLDISPLTTHLTDNQQRVTYSNDMYTIQQQPKYYLRDRYDEQLTYNQNHQSNDESNLSTQRSAISNQNDGRYMTISTTDNINTHPSYQTTIDRHQPTNQYQISNSGTTLQHPSVSYQTLSPPQPNRIRPDHPVSKQPSSGDHRSVSNSGNSYESEAITTTTKKYNPLLEMKTTKSSEMRAAAIKQREETREQQQNNGNSFLNRKKMYTQSTQIPSANSKESDTTKARRSINQSNSIPGYNRSRRDDFDVEYNTSSVDENNNDPYTQNRSLRNTVLSDSARKKNSSLPPIRRGQGPPYHDPPVGYSLPHGHPLRGRYPDNGEYASSQSPAQHHHHQRHSYEDVYDTAPQSNVQNRCVDCEKRKTKSGMEKYEDEKGISNGLQGSNRNRNSTYEENADQHGSYRYNETGQHDERGMYENPQQERNDNLKKSLQPHAYESPYGQQPLSTDSYLENQRRRALRDTQGYYFPYKKYTLKDYKDLQKTESQFNPYGSYKETKLDRKERAKKRMEYAAQIERPAADGLGEEYRTPRDISLRKPPYLTKSQSQDLDKTSKRERALEYVKVQVVKHRPDNISKTRYNRPDPTEQYVNSLFPEVDDDDENDDVNGEVHGQQNKNNKLDDDVDTK